MPQIPDLKNYPTTVLEQPKLVKKPTVIALAVLPHNERHYSEVVKILDYYSEMLTTLIDNTGINPDTQFQIEGDQLTRERFTFAKMLRIGNPNKHNFQNIRIKHLNFSTYL